MAERKRTKRRAARSLTALRELVGYLVESRAYLLDLIEVREHLGAAGIHRFRSFPSQRVVDVCGFREAVCVLWNLRCEIPETRGSLLKERKSWAETLAVTDDVVQALRTSRKELAPFFTFWECHDFFSAIFSSAMAMRWS